MRAFLERVKNIHLLAFGIPVLLMSGILAARGIYPFGENSFMYSDMYHQYVPFLTEFWRKLRAGESLFFSWRTGPGSDFFALYAYYLASPVYWISVFCPENLLAEFMTFFIIIKIGLGGLTFSWYLRCRYGADDLKNVWFSVFYAMSGFVAAYNWNHMWMDALVLSPLVILGLWRLVTEGRSRMYCLCLAALILTNYYMAILVCIFLVLYFAVQVWLSGLSLKEKCAAAGRFALYSLLSGAMSGVLLLPVMRAMHATGFVGGAFPKKPQFYFGLLSMLARHMPMLETERGLGHWPNIYCGVAAFVLVPLYFFHKKISLRQKIGNFLLLAVFLFAFSFNLANYVWHGFNYPNSLPARQSFLYIFVVLSMGCEAVCRDRENGWKNRLAGALCGAALLFFSGLFAGNDKLTGRVIAGAWIFLAAYFIFYVMFGEKEGMFGRCGRWMVLALVCAEACLNMAYTSVGTVRRDAYLEKKLSYRALMEAAGLSGEDAPFFRVDSLDQMTKNDGMLAGYFSVSMFSSTTNGSVAKLYERLGMGGGKVACYYRGATPFTSALLGVQYVFSEREQEDTALYERVAQADGLYLYRCRFALPVGFALSEGAYESLQRQLSETVRDPVVMQNRILSAVGSDTFLFMPLGNGEASAGEELQVSLRESGHLYGVLAEDPEGELYLEKDGETRTYKKVCAEEILDLGFHEAGDGFRLFAGEGELPQISVYRLSPDALADAVGILGAQPFVTERVWPDGLEGGVTAAQDGVLLFSVPALPGFTVTVDGQKTAPEAWGGALLAVPVTAGEHTVRIRYRESGIKEGLFFSAGGLLAFGALQFCKTGRRERAARVKKGADMEKNG